MTLLQLRHLLSKACLVLLPQLLRLLQLPLRKLLRQNCLHVLPRPLGRLPRLEHGSHLAVKLFVFLRLLLEQNITLGPDDSEPTLVKSRYDASKNL